MTGLLVDSVTAMADSLTRVRRDIHAHPELAFQEQRTSDLIAAKLAEWGIPVHRGLAGTGVVGTIGSGRGGRAIGLRADMDALPITESNTFSHASVNAGRMHACGHDGHIVMLLAAAQHLSQRHDIDGTVYLIFQPAEEDGGGARQMIRDGLFDLFPMEAIFGVHNWPGLRQGHFAVKAGATFASSNDFRITIRGKGAHAAMPHSGTDPVPVACQIVQAFQTIIARNKHPMDAAVISVTTLHAGEAVNVIAETCELRGTVRTFSAGTLDLIERRMREVVEAISLAFGATGAFEFQRKYPATVNHERETRFVAKTLRELVGPDNVHELEPTMGAEDFSFYLLEKPGCYFLIGGDGEGGGGSLHSPQYDFNDALITHGGSMWVRLVEAWFGNP